MNTKLKTTFATLLTLLVTTFTLTSCKPSEDSSSSINKDKMACVVLIAENWYKVVSHTQYGSDNGNLNVAYLNKSEDVSFELELEGHYVLYSTDYENSKIENKENNHYNLTLFDVSDSVRINLTAYYSESEDPFAPTNIREITYDANGGTYLQNNNVQRFTTEHHPRPNVSLGINLVERKGHALIGWNTKPDGSGTHIGLGSRYIDEEKPNFTLYAEWVEETAPSSFEFTYSSTQYDSLMIAKYHGTESLVCIPESLNGLPIVEIAKNAFVNCDKLHIVVFPTTMEIVNEGAFSNCAITDLFMYDNSIKIYDSSFKDCKDFSTVHINSILGGKFVSADKHSPYADKIDRLILNRNKQKIVILGGSSPYYSVDACRLKEIYPEYEPVNIAINGWFNGVMQFEIMEHYLTEGDIFMHVCEARGQYQFMASIDMGAESSLTIYDYRYFGALELNFDLISLADLRHVTRFFDVFTIFSRARAGKPTEPYTNYTNYADERGDFSKDPKIRIKAKPIKDKSITNEAYITSECYSTDGFKRLASHYDIIKNAGAKIYFACAPVNKDGLSEEQASEENLVNYMSGITNALSSRVTFLNDIHQAMFPMEDFSDSDWHLDYDHAITFTNGLAAAMGSL